MTTSPQETGQAITVPPLTPTSEPTPAPPPSPSPSPTPSFMEYEVQEGDTLVEIARRFLPEGAELLKFMERIAELNGLREPYPITPGQKLRIPRGQ
jgi:nucleoid-associated protein YgaU